MGIVDSLMNLQDIEKVGVVGGGTMGFGIALNFALGGYKTIINDLSAEALKGTQKQIRTALDLFIDEQLVTEEQASDADGLITLTTELKELAAHSDFITEVIVERLTDKQKLFKKLDALCPPHTIIVSNTSGFVVSEIGEDVKRQDKIGLTHYFAPPHIVPGVEVAKASGTSDETYAIIFGMMEKAGKIPIRIRKEKPGYLLNRIQGASAHEAARLWAEGVATAEDIELGTQTTFGFRMPHEGPFLHYDLAGVWKWPPDAGDQRQKGTEAQDEITQKIRARMAEGKPWFVDPGKFDEAIEKRDREYIRRLKALYRSGGK